MDFAREDLNWSDLLEKWPENAFHHLVDVQPEGDEKAWVELLPISEIQREEWYSDISAQEVVERRGYTGIAIWWAQRFSSEQLRSLTPDNTKVMVLNCMDTMVYYVWGSLRQLMDDRNLFCYQQLPILDMKLGRTDKVVCIFQKPQERIVISVYCVAVGPRPGDIQAYEGLESAAYETIGTKDKIYMLSQKPHPDKRKIDVPDSVKLSWLRRTFVVSKDQDYLSQEYYQQSMSHYSSWSFALHQKQVRQLLENVPRHVQIVAPGDGIGVVARMWEGEKKVISGDVVKSPWSQGVQQEDFQQTMSRGEPGDLLVLSYALSIMSEREREWVQGWDGPVAIIEPRDTMTLSGFEHVGPGVWVRGFPKSWHPMVSTTEGPMRTYGVQFSENLLALEEISYFTGNVAVQYWKAMRPLGRAVSWKDGEMAPIVIASLQEYFFYKARIKERPVYLSVIGKIWDGRAETFLLDAVNMVTTRRVYCILRPATKMKSVLKRFTSYYEGLETFYFCCPVPKEFRINCSYAQISVSAVEKDVPTFSAIWLGRNSRGFYLEVPGGMIMIPDTQESRCLLKVYVEYVPTRSYTDSVESFQSTWDKKMKQLRMRIDAYIRKGKVVDPRKSPSEWVAEPGWEKWKYVANSI